MFGVAGVIGRWGGVAEIGGLPGLIPTPAAAPGTKTLAFGFSTNSFALGFKVDFLAVASVDVGVDSNDGDDADNHFRLVSVDRHGRRLLLNQVGRDGLLRLCRDNWRRLSLSLMRQGW